MKNNAYWQERFTTLEETLNSYGNDTYNQILPAFDKTQREIQKEIDSWTIRIAKNNNVSLSEARKLLDKSELAEFKWDVNEFIKYGKKNKLNPIWMKELENASAKYHISRLEALQIRMQQEVEKAFGNELDSIDEMAKRVYSEGYYHSCYEIQKGLQIGYDIGQIDSGKLDKLISKPWAADGKNFSSRVWQSKTTMVGDLHNELVRTCLLGEAPDKTIAHMTKYVDGKFKNAKYQAGRLVMTEQAFFYSASQKDAFNDLDVEQFEIVATLDSHTSDICQQMDGKHFPMKDFQPGVTAPPFHVWCRSCTCPYFDDEFTGGERASRDKDGKTYYVPENMKYEEWYDKAVKTSPEYSLKVKKEKNYRADKDQYKKYIKTLGKEYLPNTFEGFQNIKYIDANEYNIIKAQANAMNYYNKALLNEPEISATVKSISQKANGELLGFKYRIKTKDSYLRKVRATYSGGKTGYEVKDIIRYTIGGKNDKIVNITLESIENFDNIGYNVFKVKNYWLNKSNPYNGINTFVRTPSGQAFEVQYHTKESFNLKNGKLHELYEKARIIGNETDSEFIRLREEMFDLSDSLKVPTKIERVKKK